MSGKCSLTSLHRALGWRYMLSVLVYHLPHCSKSRAQPTFLVLLSPVPVVNGRGQMVGPKALANPKNHWSFPRLPLGFHHCSHLWCPSLTTLPCFQTVLELPTEQALLSLTQSACVTLSLSALCCILVRIFYERSHLGFRWDLLLPLRPQATPLRLWAQKQLVNLPLVGQNELRIRLAQFSLALGGNRASPPW